MTQAAQVEAAFAETQRASAASTSCSPTPASRPRLVPVGDCPEESWRRVLDVNLTGVFL